VQTFFLAKEIIREARARPPLLLTKILKNRLNIGGTAQNNTTQNTSLHQFCLSTQIWSVFAPLSSGGVESYMWRLKVTASDDN
jgi:hypothetical protein